MSARSRQCGLTLLELLVAISIMAVSVGLLYRVLGGNARSAADIDGYQRAVVLAKSLLSLRDTVPEGGWQDSGESAGYSWRIESAPYDSGVAGPTIPQLWEVGVTIGWTEGTAARSFALNTLRPLRKPPEPPRQ